MCETFFWLPAGRITYLMCRWIWETFCKCLPSLRTPRIPQELCDLVISYAPKESLLECSLVCKDWVHLSSRRLLSTFAWKSMRQEVKCLDEFQKALAASPRLQGAIRTSKLGYFSLDAWETSRHTPSMLLFFPLSSIFVPASPIFLERCRLLVGGDVVRQDRFESIYGFTASHCFMKSPDVRRYGLAMDFRSLMSLPRLTSLTLRGTTHSPQIHFFFDSSTLSYAWFIHTFNTSTMTRFMGSCSLGTGNA